MSSYVEGIIVLVCINIIAVLGVSILTGFTRLFLFGNAGFMAIGAYTSAILTTQFDVPFFIAVASGTLLAGIVSLGLGKLTLKLKGDYFLITTLGFGECVRLICLFFDDITGGARGITGISQDTTIWVAIIAAILAFVGAWNFLRSKYGRNIMAIREQEIAGEAVGIDTARFKEISFVISAVYAGLAGALFSHYYMFIQPIMFNLPRSAELTITVVIGGLGSLSGSVLATIILTVLPELLRSFSGFRMLLYGLAVVVIIVIKPSGLMGYREFSLKRILLYIRGLLDNKKVRSK